ALWDTLCEIVDDLSLPDYLRRAHTFCGLIRLADGHVPAEDRRREAFMAAQIRQAADEFAGPLVVGTGAYHSYALFARLTGRSFVGLEDPTPDEWQQIVQEGVASEAEPSAEAKGDEVPPGIDKAANGDVVGDAHIGLALTPYSYERLDSLRGY